MHRSAGGIKENPLRPETGEEGVRVNGADRDRTDNLLDATEALSQLSYGPADTDLAVVSGGASISSSQPAIQPASHR